MGKADVVDVDEIEVVEKVVGKKQHDDEWTLIF
jgi:hypothetical protein